VDLIPVELSRILITEHDDQQMISLREKDGKRSFPIVIGSMEALAIDRRLKGQSLPRPLTHDLLASVIEAMGGHLERIVIDGLEDHTFIATLHIGVEGKVLQVDSRPSDAIALGVAFDTPMFVAKQVFDEVLREPETAEERIEILRQRMDMLANKMTEVRGRLSDKVFIAQASEDLLADYRRSLQEMQAEHDAIKRVIDKYD